MVFDTALARRKILASWGYTLLGVFNIVFLFLVASVISLHFGGAPAFVALLSTTVALAVSMFFLNEVVVGVFLNAREPEIGRDQRFLEALSDVSGRARFWIPPRGKIVSIQNKPNAMAYGMGFPGFAVVGVSQELVDLLDDEELRGVIAHECGHIKSRDIGIITTIGLLLNVIDRLGGALKARNGVVLKAPIGYAAGLVLYIIGRLALALSRFSISQERELAADALGAFYMRDPDPLMRALRKLNNWRRKNEEADESTFLGDLMVSHPGLEERLEHLQQLNGTHATSARK